MAPVLCIFLDGYEQSLADRMMAEGRLPALARLREESARFVLDHGAARLTGLASEHVSTGLSPDDAERWAAVHFDADSYEIWQEGTRFTPFTKRMRSKTVIFDVPYFDIAKAGNVQGLAAWGAHDPGTELSSNPAGLADEVNGKFGPYPATKWIYGFAWPSPLKCQAMGDALTHGARLRSEIARWLLTDRFPEWDLAMIGVSEPHSVLEGLWHGIDEDHPLHRLPSAAPAGAGVRNVYGAVDRLMGELSAAFADATIVIFSMHGMGPNLSDIASMVLLPELLHRHAFGRSVFKQPKAWSGIADGIPLLGEEERWGVETPQVRIKPSRWLKNITTRQGDRVRNKLNAVLRRLGSSEAGPQRKPMTWMPATRYQPLWHMMPVFALPSFYNGRIRINLEGRESCGMVPADRYLDTCREIEHLLRECRNPLTGEGVFDRVVFNGRDDPMGIGPTQADLDVMWKDPALAFEHPKHGRIGPVPYRRTGGHTGPNGVAFIKGKDIEPGDRGIRSSFDVVPTLFDLLEERLPSNISGRSLLAQ